MECLYKYIYLYINIHIWIIFKKLYIRIYLQTFRFVHAAIVMHIFQIFKTVQYVHELDYLFIYEFKSHVFPAHLCV